MKRIYAATLVVLGLVAGYLLIQQGPRPLTDAPQFYFHPDSVLKVEWDQATFARQKRSDPWQPAVEVAVMQHKLNTLASAPLTKLSFSDTPETVIHLHFGTANVWQGHYGGGVFAWITGAKAGQGFRVDDSILGRRLKAVLEEGRYAFAPHVWEWCVARPTRISWAEKDRSIEFVNEGGRWNWRGAKQDQAKPADSTFIEKWLGQNCRVEVDSFKDLKTFSVGWGLSEGTFEIEFVDGKRLKLARKKDFWLVNEEQAFASKRFDQALDGLAKSAHN